MPAQEKVHYTREVLMKMNDNQLNEMLGYLKNRIETGRKTGKNMQDDEVEFCYLQDEFYRRSRWSNNKRDRRPDRPAHRGDSRRTNIRADVARPRRHYKNSQSQ